MVSWLSDEQKRAGIGAGVGSLRDQTCNMQGLQNALPISRNETIRENLERRKKQIHISLKNTQERLDELEVLYGKMANAGLLDINIQALNDILRG